LKTGPLNRKTVGAIQVIQRFLQKLNEPLLKFTKTFSAKRFLQIFTMLLKTFFVPNKSLTNFDEHPKSF
jgi:flagellar biosynthesis protein FlhB